MTVTVTERIVLSDTAALAVDERGEPGADRPTVVLTHGWPDSSVVWRKVADRLAARFHVVTFDARGIGRSTPAMVHRPYDLRRMADDIDAVIAAVSPDRPVHLVGHDWGSVEAWEYIGDSHRQPRVRSFTSVSGPCLDHLGHSLRARLRSPRHGKLTPVLAQAVKSSYIAFLHVPVASTVIWRLGFGRLFRRWLRLTEGITVADGPGPTLAKDAIAGIGLYRSNIGRRLRRPQVRRTDLPVQLIVARRDNYVTHRLYDDVAQWAPNLRRADLDAGHWSPVTHPDDLAELIASHIDALEHGSEAGQSAAAITAAQRETSATT